MKTSKLQTAAVYLIPLGVFSLIAACFFYEAIFAEKVFSARDHYLFFMPRRFFALETILNGALPLWNPLNACGVPFLANVQSSLFYPLSALIYLLPFTAGYNAFVIIHYILAALCMYALMRHWKCSPLASAIAGLVFAFGGYMQSINDNLAFLTATTWLPLILLFFSKALHSRRLIYSIITMLLIGLQVFSGDASFCILSTGLCTAMYALLVPRKVVSCEPRMRAGILLMVWLGGLLLAAIVLLPFFEYVRFSDRAAGLTLEESLRWSLHPFELLQFVNPYLFGRLIPHTRWFGQHWLDTVYIGIFPLCFAAIYILRSRCAFKLFLASGTLLGLFLALGSYNPLLSFIMQHVPALRLMQYPVKFLLLCAFCLSIMSGFGIDEFFLRMRARSTIRGILKPLLLPVCVLLSLLLIASAAREPLFELFLSMYPLSDYYAPLRNTLFFNIYQGAFYATILFGGFAGLAWYTIRFKHKPILPAVLIGVIICADLFLLGAPGDPWLDRQKVVQPGSVIKALQHDDSLYRIYSLSRIAGGVSYSHMPQLSFNRVYKVLTQSVPPNLHLYYGLASVDEYAEMLNVRHYEVLAPVLLHFTNRSKSPEGIQYCRKIFSMLNVKYILSPYALPELQFDLVRDGPIKTYQNQNVWPRAFMADTVVVCPDDAGVLEKIHGANFKPQTIFLPRTELDRLPQQLQSTVTSNKPNYNNQNVTVVNYGANRVELQVDTKNSGLLVLSDTWFPGWTALVNGNQSPVLRVNHTLRAVALKPGASHVVFVYRPRSFFAGLIISAATLLAMITALAALWLRSSHHRSTKAGTVKQ